METEELFKRLKTVYVDKIYKTHISQLSCPYLTEAINFLYDTETTIDIKLVYQSTPPWNEEEPVNVYRVTLRNKHYTYEFNFYSSIYDTYGPDPKRGESMFDRDRRLREHKKIQARKLRIYDILACLQIDYIEDFEDFCVQYGYNVDSRKALATWEAVRAETKAIKRLWPSELDQLRLNEIN